MAKVSNCDLYLNRTDNPRLTNVERDSMMDYVGYVIKAKEYQHKAHTLSKDMLINGASIQKVHKRTTYMEHFTAQVKKIKQLSNKSDAPLSLFLSLKEIYEDEYIYLKEEINFYDRSGLSDDEVYKHTEWRYMTQCGIIETLSGIAAKIKAMIKDV